MKPIIKITTLFAVIFCFAGIAQAQEQTGSLRDRIANRQGKQQSAQGVNVPQLSVRAQMANQSQDLSQATWIREVYRELDLTKGRNGALLHPVTPSGNRMNLYTMIFKLMGEGKLTGYNFTRGENFDEDAKEDFKDVLERLEIPFKQNGNVFSYDDFSIPSNEVLKYYIKEAWYFDQSNSVLDVKVVAICPVLMREEFLDDFSIGGKALAQPQFWIPYEQIRPYAARVPVMVSDKNNVVNKTIDDFFRLRLYEGDIYKTTNMENKFLSEIYKTPEELEAGRQKIEKELRQFDKQLWVINDSTKLQTDGKNKDKKVKKTRVQKSSSSSATYSARDRRQ